MKINSMIPFKPSFGLLILAVAFVAMGCGGQNSEANGNSNSDSGNSDTELTDFEMTNGIGPVKEEITIQEVDPELAEKGAEIFDVKCSACHKMDERYVGPPLGGILNSRTPAFVMNMILNPDEMVEKHPIPKALFREYLTPMPNQQLSREEARAVVEYFASEMENTN
ncbi:c-type cytochrome [Halalkalibaculum sp. DA3122]|uniref:c-type cytochrome n=1 Tax=unclassified Halalkalibaculum TaxID=2964617 RepID=UPI00375410CB